MLILKGEFYKNIYKLFTIIKKLFTFFAIYATLCEEKLKGINMIEPTKVSAQQSEEEIQLRDSEQLESEFKEIQKEILVSLTDLRDVVDSFHKKKGEYAEVRKQITNLLREAILKNAATCITEHQDLTMVQQAEEYEQICKVIYEAGSTMYEQTLDSDKHKSLLSAQVDFIKSLEKINAIAKEMEITQQEYIVNSQSSQQLSEAEQFEQTKEETTYIIAKLISLLASLSKAEINYKTQFENSFTSSVSNVIDSVCKSCLWDLYKNSSLNQIDEHLRNREISLAIDEVIRQINKTLYQDLDELKFQLLSRTPNEIKELLKQLNKKAAIYKIKIPNKAQITYPEHQSSQEPPSKKEFKTTKKELLDKLHDKARRLFGYSQLNELYDPKDPRITPLKAKYERSEIVIGRLFEKYTELRENLEGKIKHYDLNELLDEIDSYILVFFDDKQQLRPNDECPSSLDKSICASKELSQSIENSIASLAGKLTPRTGTNCYNMEPLVGELQELLELLESWISIAKNTSNKALVERMNPIIEQGCISLFEVIKSDMNALQKLYLITIYINAKVSYSAETAKNTYPLLLDFYNYVTEQLAPPSEKEEKVIKKDAMKITTLFDANIKAQLNLVNTQSSQQSPDLKQFKEAKNKTTNQLSDLRKSLSLIEAKRFKEEGYFKHLTYMLTEMYQDLCKNLKLDIKSNMDIFQVINEIEVLVNEICCRGDSLQYESLLIFQDSLRRLSEATGYMKNNTLLKQSSEEENSKQSSEKENYFPRISSGKMKYIIQDNTLEQSSEEEDYSSGRLSETTEYIIQDNTLEQSSEEENSNTKQVPTETERDPNQDQETTVQFVETEDLSQLQQQI